MEFITPGSRAGRGVALIKKLASALLVGSTKVSGGVSGKVLYDNAGILGELATLGSGSVVLSSSLIGSGNVALANGPTAWTPTDLSGAGLTFTVTTGQYYQVGKLTMGFLNMSYPVTASGLAAAISLPVTGNSAEGIAPFGFCYISTEGGTNAYQVTSVNAIQFLPFAANLNYTNANLSGATILMAPIFLAA